MSILRSLWKGTDGEASHGEDEKRRAAELQERDSGKRTSRLVIPARWSMSLLIMESRTVMSRSKGVLGISGKEVFRMRRRQRRRRRGISVQALREHNTPVSRLELVKLRHNRPKVVQPDGIG